MVFTASFSAYAGVHAAERKTFRSTDIFYLFFDIDKRQTLRNNKNNAKIFLY